MHITATLPEKTITNAKPYRDTKTLHAVYHVIGVGKSRSDIVNVARLEVFRPSSRRAETWYATIRGNNEAGPGYPYFAGSGHAGGGGYNKLSAAADRAIKAAGITLSESIYGCGERAVEDALYAIGIAAGFDTVRVIGG